MQEVNEEGQDDDNLLENLIVIEEEEEIGNCDAENVIKKLKKKKSPGYNAINQENNQQLNDVTEQKTMDEKSYHTNGDKDE